MIKRQIDEPFARNRAQAADFISDDLLELGVVGGHAFQVTHRGTGHQCWERSRPRDPWFPEPSMFVGRAIGIRLEAWHVFAAREDARPPGQGAVTLRLRLAFPELTRFFRLNGCDAGESCEAPDAYA